MAMQRPTQRPALRPRHPVLDEMTLSMSFTNVTPAQAAKILVERYGSSDAVPYTAHDWPDEPLLVSSSFHHHTLRQMLLAIAEEAGGTCIVDGAHRILFCQVERRMASFDTREVW